MRVGVSFYNIKIWDLEEKPLGFKDNGMNILHVRCPECQDISRPSEVLRLLQRALRWVCSEVVQAMHSCLSLCLA